MCPSVDVHVFAALTMNFTICDYNDNVTSANFTYCQVLHDPQNAVNWTVNNGRTPSAKKRNRMIDGVMYPATGPLTSTSGNGYLYVPSKSQPAGSVSRYAHLTTVPTPEYATLSAVLLCCATVLAHVLRGWRM